jgi:hypothetical protein
LISFFWKARVLAGKMLKSYTGAQQQIIQLKQLSFSNELVGKLELDLLALQGMYHDMQALILASKNLDSDYEALVLKHIELVPSFTAHTTAAKALLQSAAPKKESKRKVFKCVSIVGKLLFVLNVI